MSAATVPAQLHGTKDDITVVANTHSSRYTATASDKGSIVLWDLDRNLTVSIRIDVGADTNETGVVGNIFLPNFFSKQS